MAVTLPPLVWVGAFLLTPYLLMFCYSFWSVFVGAGYRSPLGLDNYRELLRVGGFTGKRYSAPCGSAPG